MATKPQISPPGAIFLITHVITQRDYLLTPDGKVNQNVLFLLAYMQLCYGVEIHAVSVLSNHLHVILTDVRGDQLGKFNNHFFSLLGRSMNAYRRRSENFVNNQRPNCALLAPLAETLIDKASYVSTQAVEAGLVSHSRKWPGVSFHPRDCGQLEIEIDRPDFFYDPDGPTPDSATFRLTLPECLDMDPDPLRHRMVEQHNSIERQKRTEYRRNGRKFLGAKRVLRQSPNSRPKTDRPLFTLVPRVACKNKELRVRFLLWSKERNRRYRMLMEFVREGTKDVVFPVGTLTMHFQNGFEREPWTKIHPSGCIWKALLADP